MYRAEFTLFRDFFFSPVSVRNLFHKVISFSAILKDATAVSATDALLFERKNPKDKKNKWTISKVNKFYKKYTVYVVAFIFEDLGQVLCQETLIRTWIL